MTKREIDAKIRKRLAIIAGCASGAADCGVCIMARESITELELKRSTEIPEAYRALSCGKLKL